jgi:antitoxin component of RelBE/YafQ-DinJ toxin-antitoxin module
MPPKEPNKPFSTRLPDDVRAELKALAQSTGLTESDLGRMFIIDKLREAKAGPSEARMLAALTIAALSETIDLDQAKELVAHHLSPEPPVST